MTARARTVLRRGPVPALAAGVLAAALPAQGEADAESRAAAIAAGLGWLVRAQQDDGGMPAPPLQAHDRFVDTTFAALALLAAGERLDGGAHHPALRRLVRWLQDAVPERGPLRVARPRPEDWQRFETWYAALAGLLFAELLQQSPAPDLERTARALRARIVALQKENGGWCHDLQPRVRQIPGLGRAEYSDDLCAVGCLCVAALDALAGAGVNAPADHPDEVLERGIAWLLALQNGDGGFDYGTGHPAAEALLSEPGRSAGSLFALLPLLGRDDARCLRAAGHLDHEFPVLPLSAWHGNRPFVISWLHGAWCCARWGSAASARYLAEHGPDLLRRQRDDGSFGLGTSVWDTDAIGTATAVLCLLGGRSALRCTAPVAAGAAHAPAAAAARWLLECGASDGGADGQEGQALRLDGRWGDRSVDLALTGVAARALREFDPLGHGHRAVAAARWAAAEVAALHGRDFELGRRSHLGFQLPLVLPLLLDHRGDDGVARAARRVVGELAASQRADGGWSYDRDPLYTLLSTTAPVLITLCDARAAGLRVPEATLSRAADYVEACQGAGGGFRYCPDPSHPILARDRARYLREEVPRTVVAVAALAAAGRAGGEAHARGVAFLERHLTKESLPDDDHHLWFSLLWGDRLAGPPLLRARWDELVAARLEALREDDGGQRWPGMAWSGALGRPPMYPVFATAAALHLRVAPSRRRP